jgi:hypothetical protein
LVKTISRAPPCATADSAIAWCSIGEKGLYAPPMTCHEVAERTDQRKKGGNDRVEPPLQAARRADADQLPHEEAEIEAARVYQHSLPYVRVPAGIHAAHATDLVKMRERPLQALAA